MDTFKLRYGGLAVVFTVTGIVYLYDAIFRGGDLLRLGLGVIFLISGLFSGVVLLRAGRYKELEKGT